MGVESHILTIPTWRLSGTTPLAMRTVLNSVHNAAGAQFCAYHGWEIPENFGSVEAEYQALRRAAL